MLITIPCFSLTSKQTNYHLTNSKNNELKTIKEHKSIFGDKKKKLAEIQNNYKKMLKNKAAINIELVDTKGDKVNIKGICGFDYF